MGFPGPIAFAVAIVSAGLAGMVGLGTYSYLRDKKRWGGWKAGLGAGAIAAGVGAGLRLGLSFIPTGATSGLGMITMRDMHGIEMNRLRGIEMQRLRGVVMNPVRGVTMNQIGAMPFVTAGVTATRLSGVGCCGL
jgi:hypothetical protein